MGWSFRKKQPAKAEEGQGQVAEKSDADSHTHGDSCSQDNSHGHAHSPVHGKAAAKKPAKNGCGGVKNIIAVSSGKGGVGKSTTSINLALAFHQRLGLKVGVLDADIWGPSLKVLTKAPPPNQMNGDLVVPSQAHGLKLISGALFSTNDQAHILRGPMAANMVKQFLLQVDWGELDILIIDYPPGTGDIQLTISQSVSLSGAVVVTTPQELALADVRKAMEMFQTLKVPILGVVETMSYFECDSCNKKHPIFSQNGGEKLARTSGAPLLGQIPLLEKITTACDQGTPFLVTYPAHPAAQIYEDIARGVMLEISKIRHASTMALSSFSLDWRSPTQNHGATEASV